MIKQTLTVQNTLAMAFRFLQKEDILRAPKST